MRGRLRSAYLPYLPAAPFRYVATHGAEFGLDEASRIVVCGDSAGGQHTLELGLRVRDTPGLLQPVLLAPIYPATNLCGARFPSWDKYAEGYGMSKVSAERLYASYLGPRPELHASNSYLNPILRESFAGVAPMVLFYSEFDVLCDDGREFVKVANARGGDVEEMFGAGHMHAAFSILFDVPSALVLFNEFCARIKARVGVK